MEIDNNIGYLDFERIENLAGTRPVSFSFFDITFHVAEWTKLFVSLLWLLLQEYPQIFQQFAADKTCTNDVLWITRSDNKDSLKKAEEIGDDYWVETATSTEEKIQFLGYVLDCCCVNKGDVVITYKNLGADSNRYNREDKEAFFVWLTKEKNLDTSLSEKYISALKELERYSRKKLYISGKIYDLDKTEIEVLIQRLSSDPEVKSLFGKMADLNKYAASIEKLREYKGALSSNNKGILSLTTKKTNTDNPEEPYYIRYSIDPNLYHDITIQQLGLSNRLERRLYWAEILSLSDLLRLNSDDIKCMKGLGQGCVLELEGFFSSFETRVQRAKKTSAMVNTNNYANNQNAKGKKQGESESKEESKPLYELYGLNIEDYDSLSLDEFSISNKLRNTLYRAEIRTVSSLLSYSFDELQQIRSFGNSCRVELEKFIQMLLEYEIPTTQNSEKTNEEIQITEELEPFIDDLKKGDFSFVGTLSLSEPSMKFINHCRAAHEDLGPELVNDILESRDVIVAIYSMLRDFPKTVNGKLECKEIIKSIPEHILDVNAERIIKLYSNDEKKTKALFELIRDENDSLKEYLLHNWKPVVYHNPSFHNLINWCCFDLNAEMQGYFTQIVKNERSLAIINMRAMGNTLDQVGKAFDITRERVRQIENKEVSVFIRWQKRVGLIQHILLELEENNSFSSSELNELLVEYGAETIYLLKNCKSDAFHYDKNLDLFIFEDPSLLDSVQSYVDDLPETFDESKYDSFVDTAKKDYGYPENIVVAVLNDNYKKTGKIFHRSRFTLERLYADILRRFYPDGLHVYTEYQRVLDIASSEYGIDLGEKNAHAVASVFSRICILRGRGIYKARDNTTVLSDQLANKIKDYINNSDAPVFMTNTLYTLFEDELLKEGIDNKYYLQGLLRDRFDGEWIFKRDYISKDPKYTTIGSSIVEYIRKSNHPVKREDIQSAFPGVTDIVISFATYDPSIINLFGSYVHSSKLHFSRNDIEYLRKVLLNTMGEKGYCSCHDLYDYINHDYKEILTNNFITIPFSLFSVIEYLFRDEYRFNRPFISREDAVFEKPSEVLAEIIRDSDVISTQEIIALSKEYKVYIYSQLEYFDSLNDTHLLLDGFNLASIPYIGVDENIAKIVETAVLSEIAEATPISQLNCVSALPVINVQWNAWLIYSVLKKWSDKLVVFPSDSQFKKSYPIVSLKDKDVDLVVDDGLSHDGNIHTADDLSNIDDLIESYLTEELGVE